MGVSALAHVLLAMTLLNGNISLLQFWHEPSNPASRQRTLGALGKEAFLGCRW